MREIHRFASLPSTMLKAAELAQSGCASGTVVVAERADGRTGTVRPFLALRTGCGTLHVAGSSAEDLPGQPAAGHAWRWASRRRRRSRNVAGVAPDLRWPNDVLVNGRKCAGILVQLHDGVLIAGIGINVNHTAFPEELRRYATSLRIATGRDHDPEQLLQALSTSMRG